MYDPEEFFSTRAQSLASLLEEHTVEGRERGNTSSLANLINIIAELAAAGSRPTMRSVRGDKGGARHNITI